MITKDYVRNRAQFPMAELVPHRGKWAAFNPEGNIIIASAETAEGLEIRLAELGMSGQDVVWEWVPGADEDCILGAEEWQ